MLRSIVSTGLMLLINPFNHPKSPSLFYCWRYRVPMITPLFPAFPKKTNPIDSQWNRESFPLHCIAFFVWHWWYFLTIVWLHSQDIPIKNITIFPFPWFSHCLPMISPCIQELHLLLLVPFLTQRWLLALGGAGGPVVLLHGFHLGWLRLCGERYRAPGYVKTQWGSAATRDTYIRDVQVPSSDIFKWFKLGSMWNVFLDHHLSIKIAVSCAIRTI